MNISMHSVDLTYPKWDPESADCSLEWSESTETALSESAFEDGGEITTCKLLAQMIEGVLREAKEQKLPFKEILIPTDLTIHIAQDIMLMSENEPCGLRGCILFVNLEEKTACQRLGRVACDPEIVATFEITLTLQQDCSKWQNLRRFITFKGFGKKPTLVIGKAYKLCKKKLYRSSLSC